MRFPIICILLTAICVHAFAGESAITFSSGFGDGSHRRTGRRTSPGVDSVRVLDGVEGGDGAGGEIKSMSVICCLRRTTDMVATRLLQEPELIHDFLEQPRPQAGGLIARLFGRNPATKANAAPLSFSRFDGDEFDTDKAWHGIHYLLTESAEEGTAPLNFLSCGGETIGDVDVGYGPARVMLSSKVVVLNNQLSGIQKQTCD